MHGKVGADGGDGGTREGGMDTEVGGGWRVGGLAHVITLTEQQQEEGRF